MEVTIQKIESIKVAGLTMEAIDNSKCPVLWEELFKMHSPEVLENLGNGQSFGVCFNMEDSDLFQYMAGYEVKNVEKAKQLNLEVKEIPENTYAVIMLKGAIPGCIHEGWKYFFEEYLPKSNYEYNEDPVLEVYYEGDMSSPYYEMELWIPVK